MKDQLKKLSFETVLQFGRLAMKVLKTNWINVLGVFVIVYLYMMTLNHLYIPRYDVFQLFISAGILVCLYGMMFWSLFVLSLIVLDLILFVRNQSNLKVKLLSEWLVISSPFIYWTVRHNEWIFLVGVGAFLITQLMREKVIKKALDTSNPLS